MEDSIAKVLSPFFLFLQLFAASTACSEKYSSVEYIEIQLGSPSYYVAKWRHIFNYARRSFMAHRTIIFNYV